MKLPNVILIVMDAARADHLSCYGYGRPTTPYLDKMAEEGAIYEAAISPAVWTVPSHASLFTGRYLSGHGLRGRNLRLQDDVPTLASVLSSQGYETLGLTANALVSAATGLSRGFVEFKEMRRLFQSDDLVWWQRKVNGLYRRLYYGSRDGERFDDGAWRLNWEMKRWINRRVRDDQGQRPFFIFANYKEPHLRYHPPRSFREKFLTQGQLKRWKQVNQNAWRYMSGEVEMSDDDWEILIGLYDAELAYLDTRLGQIYNFLQQRGILDDTILIITSDHGENLGEHNLMDHQYCVYDTLAKVPLIIRYPQRFSPGTRVSSLVQTLDIFPTLVSTLLEEDALSKLPLEGKSLLPETVIESPRPFAIVEYLAPQLHSFKRESLAVDGYFSRQLRAIRTEAHKYIWASDGNHELYDLANDPGETLNLIDRERETAVTLAQQLEQWLNQFSQQEESEDSLLDDAVVSRLEALGYI